MSESTIHRWLEAWRRHDAATLLACYHRDATFSDPVLPDLRRDAVQALIRLRLARLDALQVDVRWMAGDEHKGSLHCAVGWRPRGAPRSRLRQLEITSTFTFWDGEIVRQIDQYSGWAYLRQVRGPSGFLLGWLPGSLDREQRRAAAALNRFIDGQAHADVPAPTLESVS